jgi:hypothetical protein
MGDGDEVRLGRQSQQAGGRRRGAEAGDVFALGVAGDGADAGLRFLGEQAVAVELSQLAGNGQGLVIEARGEGSGLVFAGALEPACGELTGGGEGAACRQTSRSARSLP